MSFFRRVEDKQIFEVLGEAFSHPENGHEGRIDLIAWEVPAPEDSSDAVLVSLPFGDLHGSRPNAAFEIVTLEEVAVIGIKQGETFKVGPPKCYKHWKGAFYQELARVRGLNKDDGDQVLYQTLYSSNYALFTRPVANFQSEVDQQPGVKRFAPAQIEELDRPGFQRIISSINARSAGHPCAVDRVALVTGTSSGLGQAIAETLALAGFMVFATARDAKKLGETLAQRACAPGAAPELRRIFPLQLDVTDDKSVETTFEEVRKRLGRLDVLVNNAGILVVGTVEMVSIEQTRQVFETNVNGPIRCMHQALEMMRQQRAGCIINISSIFSEIPTMNQPVYAASKAALDALTLGTVEAIRPFGISIHSVQSGGIRDTEIGKNLVNGDRFEDQRQNPYPINRMVQESVFDRIIPHAQSSSEVAECVRAIAINEIRSPLLQTSEFAKNLAKTKLVDPTGETITALKY